MSALRSLSDFTSIPRAHCPNCQSVMMLSGIWPTRAALELRTFECVKCGHIEKVVVGVDPMKSHALGWVLGELRPPD
jgi:Zn ribbon nucleic-acid-binding protein